MRVLAFLKSELKAVDSAQWDAYDLHIDTCLEGTRVGLLEDIERWASTEQAGSLVFWLNGLAGTGKSTITRTVCENLLRTQKGRLVASFFFSRRTVERRTPLYAIHTIAHQLALGDDFMRGRILDALRTDPSLARKAFRTQIKSLIAEPLRARSHPQRPVVVMLDALDECDKEDGQEGGLLLPLLVFAFRDTSHVKLFVTSRDEKSIRSMFGAIQTTERPGMADTVWLHKIEKHIVQEDIRIYLVRSLKRIATKHSEDDFGDDWPDESVVSPLLKRAGVLFIFAATVIRYVSDENDIDGPKARIRGLLQSTQTEGGQYDTLDRLYQDVLSRAAKVSDRELKRFCADLHRVIGALVLLQDPLTPTALANLLELEVERIRRILWRLSAVVIVEKELPASLFHPSFSDFILDPSRCTPKTRTNEINFHVVAPHHHIALSRCCLQVMNSNLRYDICSIWNPGLAKVDVTAPDFPSRLEKDISEALRYACRYWMPHLALSDVDSDADLSDIYAQLDTFCDGRVLHWLEAMCLLGELRQAQSALHDAVSWCSVSALFSVTKCIK
jgi:hypothetical protein